ncbi:MAG: phage BR0599 family protein [Candidatus Omnitrophica bacterium]|nr:phage BR0599 family protein [Candidatus Omnitrophota bacterium]
MTRILSPNTITEKNKLESEDILSFVDIFLEGETLHFVNNAVNLNFFDLDENPALYQGLKMTREKKEDSMDMEIQTVSAGLDNVDRGMSAYIASKDFRDRRIVIRAVFRNLISDGANAWKVFDGFIDKPNISEKDFTIELVPRLGRGTLNSKIGVKQQLPCRLPFAGAKCAYGKDPAVLKDEKTAQIVDSGTTGYIVDSAQIEADDYWNFGFVTFANDTLTVALRGITRMVNDFDSAENKIHFKIALPVAPQAGDTYKIERGCDLTLASCQDKFNNDINYGGIHTLPATMVRT